MLSTKPYIGSRLLTVYRGQQSWKDGDPILASSMRRAAGAPHQRVTWTDALLGQFRLNIAGAQAGDVACTHRLEALLLDAQAYAFANPFVSCSFSAAVARSFANAGDNRGFVLVIEGPWDKGVDFEGLRNSYRLYANAFDYLQEFGLPKKLEPPFNLVTVYECRDPFSVAVRIWP